ncbi:MAG: hypothetical protein IJV71_03520 [Lachnospiraceae bacterium]|nr:hypothetical protein [Lachnospiraceae bacterium]
MQRLHSKEPLSEEAKFLMRYLEQYSKCKEKKARLEARRACIIREFENPLSGINYDGMPKGNKISVGSASLALRLDEIDTIILQQKEKAAKLLLEVMSVLEFLPENSTERDVLEARYIDCLKTKDVCTSLHISRTPAYNYTKDGLNKLLTFKKVQKILEEFKQRLEDEGVCL